MAILKDYGTVLMRAPLLPLNKINSVSEKNMHFREGLYLSSPELLEESLKCSKLNSKAKEKIRLSLLKYWNRACTRPTPFGLFAGSFTTEIKDGNPDYIEFGGNDIDKKIRLDMSFVFHLVHQLSKHEVIKNQLRIVPNNSIYELADKIRYVEFFLDGDKKKYELASIQQEPYIDTIIRHCKKKPSTISGLARMLQRSQKVLFQEAYDFIIELLDAQLLVFDLEPPLTGEQPLFELIERLKPMKNVELIVSTLQSIHDRLSNSNFKISDLKHVEKLIGNLPIEIPTKNLFQVDLFFKPTENHVSRETVNCILDQISSLLVFQRRANAPDLSTFASRFQARYGDKEVPLMHAIDADFGVGYGNNTDSSVAHNTLIEGINQVDYSFVESKKDSDYINQFVLKKFIQAKELQLDEIEITDKDLEEFRSVTPLKPASLYILGNMVLPDNKIHPSDKPFLLSIVSIGSFAGKILGRFGYADRRILSLLKKIAKKEASFNYDGIEAEVIHWPQGRVGNILLRPSFRAYEIPYLGISGIAAKNQIPVQDLLISVRQGNIILRSKKLQTRVYPKLTTAHAYWNNSIPLYKFLADLQYQNEMVPTFWDWGAVGFQKYLPRVVYKNILIRRAEWKLSIEDLKELPEQEHCYIEYFENFRKKNNLPERVVYVEHDNELLIDFSSVDGTKMFIQFLHRYQNIHLKEYIFHNNASVITDRNGNNYANEIVIPAYIDSSVVKEFNPLIRKNSSVSPMSSFEGFSKTIKRKMPPGSEWLMFKIYCGPLAAEKILGNKVCQFVINGIRMGHFEKFFFIRFNEESNHIRIRFYNTDSSLQMHLQSNFLKLFEHEIETEVIHKIQIDTYEREIERYKENLIEDVEELFFYDSKCIISFISHLDNKEEDNYLRFLFAMKSIDAMLNNFNFELPEKRTLIAQIYNSFFMEFGGHIPLQKKLNLKYKNLQRRIFDFMNVRADEGHEAHYINELIYLRSQEIKFLCQKLKDRLTIDGYIEDLYSCVHSYIHMSMNRLFISNQRKCELVVYLFLERYYSSQLAIQKH